MICTDAFYLPQVSSSGQSSSVDYSQSADPGSMESMPPAYSDVLKTRYPRGSRVFSWQGAPLDDQARKHEYFSSVTDGDSLSFTPPASPTTSSRSGNDLSPRRASTISETYMSTSIPPIHPRRQLSLASMSDLIYNLTQNKNEIVNSSQHIHCSHRSA
jgi:hypothetical protein